jgi:hypothetical protein
VNVADPGALNAPVTRRAALLATAGLLAACTATKGRAHLDPDAATLTQARATELELLALYADGDPDRAVHLAHLSALGGTPPSPPATTPPARAAAAAAVRASVGPLQAAAVAAHRGDTAALLASLAASHAALAGQAR